jgi:hypothetical protein
MIKRFFPAAVPSALLGALLLSCSPAQPRTLDEIAARALSYDDTAEKASVVESVNAFSIDLYKQLGDGQDGNLFYSPFSIEAAPVRRLLTCIGEPAEPPPPGMEEVEPRLAQRPRISPARGPPTWDAPAIEAVPDWDDLAQPQPE